MFPFLSKLIAILLSQLKAPTTENSSTTLGPATQQRSSRDQPTNTTQRDTEDTLQREIRQGRKFSLAEAISREGGSFMKGESTIPRPLRATNAIKQFINSQVTDPSSAFATTLFTWASTDIRVSRQLDTPLVALTQILESLLNEPTIFYEFARQVAIAHSAITGDRPHFQQPHHPPHLDADYTHQSIRDQLVDIFQTLDNPSHP